MKYEKTAMLGKDGTPNPNPYYEEKVEAVAEISEEIVEEVTEEATEEMVAEEVVAEEVTEEVADEVVVAETEATTETEEVAEETVAADSEEAVEPIMAITEYEYTDEVVIPDKEDTCECQELRCTISGLEAQIGELTAKCEAYEKLLAEDNEVRQEIYKKGVEKGIQSIEHDVVMLCECLYKLGFDVDLMYNGPKTEEAPTEKEE